MKYLPSKVPELVAQLEETYPHRCIEPDQTLAEAHRYAGKVELIGWLRDKLNATEKKALASELTRT